MSRPLGEAERVADRHSAQRSEKEISMRLRSPRTLAAGATAVVLLAGGATAFAKSGSSSPGPSTKGPSVERALFAATLGRGLAATAMVRRVAVTRAVADCGPPVPLGDPFKAAADYLGLSVAQLANKFQGGASLADIAAQQGKSVDGLEQALIDAAKSDLDKSVAAGDMTADQEQQVLGQLSSQIDDFVNGNGGLTIRIGKGDLTLRIGGPGPGGMLDGPYKTAADYLGLSVEQLAKDLQAGKSLADVAADQGKSVDGLKQALVHAETAEIEKSVDDLVNQKGLAGPPCGGGVVGAAGIEVPRFGTPGTP